MPFIDKFLTVGGRRVGYVDEGNGGSRPLVLFHGGGFDHAELTWKPTVFRLRDARRVIVPDLPGYGESEGFRRAYDLSDLGHWALEFLGGLGLDAVDVSGVSMGGGMALWLAIHAPERIGRLVPVAPYGIMPRAPFHSLAWALAHSPVAGLVYRAPARFRTLARIGLGTTYGARSRVTDDAVRDLMAVAADQARRRSFDRFLAAELTPRGLKSDLSRELSQITAPTLLVHGTADRIVPLRYARRAADLIPDARLVTLPTGHWPMREQPDAFVERLGEFLNEGDA